MFPDLVSLFICGLLCHHNVKNMLTRAIIEVLTQADTLDRVRLCSHLNPARCFHTHM